MANEQGRKKIGDELSYWEQMKVGLTPGIDAAERSRRMEQMADDKIRERERQLALKMKTQPTNQGGS